MLDQYQKAKIYDSELQIQYILVSSDDEVLDTDFLHISGMLLRELPKDYQQLMNPIMLYEFNKKMVINTGVNIFTIPDQFFNNSPEIALENLNKYSRLFTKAVIRVYLIQSNVVNLDNLLELIRSEKFSFFIIVGDDIPELDEDAQKIWFQNGNDLVQKLKNSYSELIESLRSKNIEFPPIEFETLSYSTDINPYYNTNICESNYFVLNQILGNLWKERPTSDPTSALDLREQRVQLQINQVNAIDRCLLSLEDLAAATPIEPLLNTLIIIAPFHLGYVDGDLNETLPSKERKAVLKIFKSEQKKDYSYVLDHDAVEVIGKEQAPYILAKIHEKLQILDFAAYLHASLTYSPIIRLPLAGPSIKGDLSHIHNGFPTKIAALKKILIVGKKLANKYVDGKFADLIRDRNGQIAFVSDLPMEWLIIDKYPLIMTHDICRMPEFNSRSLVNTYVQNQRLKYSIPRDILKKTLIIHCASEKDQRMQVMFKTIDSNRDKFGFTSVSCKTIGDISAAVNRYKPDLLIFDCHGGFDKTTSEGYLIIDAEKRIYLTGEDVVKHGISAPLVFISACSTMPSYGYTKFLSDAFFQVGAFSVTATFLPILMMDATVLIIRILNNLQQHENKVFHFNWLAFLSHTFRGVMVFEMVRRFRKKNPEIEIEDKTVSEWLTELMVFERRGSIFDKITETLSALSKKKMPFDQLNNEWLSYTTLGRADLIYFENWLEEFRSKNMPDYVGKI